MLKKIIKTTFSFFKKHTKKDIKVKEKKPRWKGIKTDAPIEYVFTYDNIDYFYFVNPLNIGNSRHEVLLGFLNEFHHRSSLEFSKASYDMILDCINKNHITDIVKIVNDLKTRLEWAFEPSIVLKIASCLFFDENENPYKYDYIYNTNKQMKWASIQNSMLDFFLKMPLVDGLIHLRISEKGLAIYTNTILKQAIQQVENMINTNLIKDTKNPYVQTLESQLEILKILEQKN